jgi:hypothetical protein
VAELTIDIPDELAARVVPWKEQMAEIIELGLRGLTPRGEVYGEVVDFLASGPSLQAIGAYHASAEAEARVAELLEKNQQGQLTPDERMELDDYEKLNHLLMLIKAQARQRTL